MKAIEGVSLVDVAIDGVAAWKVQQCEQLRQQCSRIYGEARSAARRIERLRVELAQADAALVKAELKVTKMLEGKWDVLPEPASEEPPPKKSKGE